MFCDRTLVLGFSVPTYQKILLLIALAYAVYCGFLYLIQDRIVFPGARSVIFPPMTSNPASPGVEKSWVKVNGVDMETWFLPVPGSGRHPTAIFAHGNAELIDHWPGELSALVRMGVGGLLVEYPGYGRSGGVPSQDTVVKTFTAAYDELMSRPDVDPERIILIGRSLGGGAVCGLAEERPSAALILMSTFTSIRTMALGRFFIPAVFVRHPFDNLHLVRDYEGPVLVVHGSRDAIVPYSHGSELAREADRGHLVTYDAGHNNCPPDWDAFWKEVEEFLRGSGIIEREDS